MPQLKENEIDARPTKKFFIESITKDINLLHVIPDLVDNCYDGALRIGKGKDLSGLQVEIEIDNNHFKIKDNCGGISIKNSREYAFRFGRDDKYKPLKGSVGEFGIGMKRAIFKLGNKIVIESKTSDEHFLIEIDVEKWKKKGEWKFEFKKIKDSESPYALKEPGVVIEATELHKEVSEEFESEIFKISLAIELQNANTIRMEKGLEIVLNSKPLGFEPLKFFVSEKLSPAFKKMEILKGTERVKVEIYAGISKRSPEEAGWYVFCNGRLVRSGDKTKDTGWIGERGNPQYHHDFAYFRGFVFFISQDSSLLPWDTTKTRVNVDSKIYKSVKLEMMKLAKPVITFLRKVAQEKRKDEEGEKPRHQPLNDEIKKSEEKWLSDLSLSEQAFEIPEPETPTEPEPKTNLICYRKLQDEVNKVKRQLKVRSNKEVGEKTFEYYYKHEIEGVS